MSPPDEETVLQRSLPLRHSNPEPLNYGYGNDYGYDDEKVYIRQMWRAIKRRKWMIAVIAIIATTVVSIEAFRSKSIYQSSATVEVGKENKTLLRSGDLVIQSDDSDDYYNSVAMKTKIRLLQSRPLLEQVVATLKLDKNPQFMDITQNKSIWEAVKSIGTGLNHRNNFQTAAAYDIEAPLPETFPEWSPEERARLAPFVDVLASNLSAEPLEETSMLVISFTHTDPLLAAQVANTTARIFIKYSFENKTEKFRESSDWLKRSTRELEARVQEAEEELAAYSRDNNIFSMDGKESLTTEKLSRLHDQATRAETDRMLKESLYQEVKAGRVAQLPDVFADPKIAALQKQLGDLAIKAADLDVEYGPKNPNVVSVRQQMAAIQEQINGSRSMLEEKLKADYERAVRDEASLKAMLERAKSEAVQQNQAAIQFNILRQKVDTAKQLYTDFLQKTNQAKIQTAEQHNNLRLVDPAQVPGLPVGPNRMRTIMIGLMVSLFTGFCLVFVLEYLNNTIKTVEDVTRYAQLPALSVIPSLAGRSSLLMLGKKNGKRNAPRQNGSNAANFDGSEQLITVDSRSSVAEAYRVLRTSVLLSSADHPPKTVLVTSGQPGEGKTTTTVNTAISLSQLGSSVLIIDCDLRKPSVHKVLGIEPGRGISSYLSGHCEIDSLIRKLPLPNLSAITCGLIPPNPAELISSPKMKALLEVLAERYDHILIDSPPLIKVTDPVILSTMVDGVILVVHGGKSTREVVRRARQELAAVGAKMFGVVLNNVNLQRDGYDEYYYDRYYSDYTQDATQARKSSND